jgi:hypothetical protein
MAQLRISTASGSERDSWSRPLMGTPLATARGTDLLTARRLWRIDNGSPLAALIRIGAL